MSWDQNFLTRGTLRCFDTFKYSTTTTKPPDLRPYLWVRNCSLSWYLARYLLRSDCFFLRKLSQTPLSWPRPSRATIFLFCSSVQMVLKQITYNGLERILSLLKKKAENITVSKQSSFLYQNKKTLRMQCSNKKIISLLFTLTYEFALILKNHCTRSPKWTFL